MELVRLQRAVSGCSGRMQHPDDLHMTLVFLGRITPEQMACARQVADDIAADPFVLELDRTGYWKRPRIHWCAPKRTPEPLSRLVRTLQSGLTACGLQPEDREYRPHVTLARKAESVDNVALDASIIWQPREFVLAGSPPGDKLPRYRILDKWGI